MTQKELLYYEDAISHEENIIKIFNSLLPNMQDENLFSFMQEELEKHNTLKNSLLKVLEEKVHE